MTGYRRVSKATRRRLRRATARRVAATVTGRAPSGGTGVSAPTPTAPAVKTEVIGGVSYDVVVGKPIERHYETIGGKRYQVAVIQTPEGEKKHFEEIGGVRYEIGVKPYEEPLPEAERLERARLEGMSPGFRAKYEEALKEEKEKEVPYYVTGRAVEGWTPETKKRFFEKIKEEEYLSAEEKERIEALRPTKTERVGEALGGYLDTVKTIIGPGIGPATTQMTQLGVPQVDVKKQLSKALGFFQVPKEEIRAAEEKARVVEVKGYGYEQKIKQAESQAKDFEARVRQFKVDVASAGPENYSYLMMRHKNLTSEGKQLELGHEELGLAREKLIKEGKDVEKSFKKLKSGYQKATEKITKHPLYEKYYKPFPEMEQLFLPFKPEEIEEKKKIEKFVKERPFMELIPGTKIPYVSIVKPTKTMGKMIGFEAGALRNYYEDVRKEPLKYGALAVLYGTLRLAAPVAKPLISAIPKKITKPIGVAVKWAIPSIYAGAVGYEMYKAPTWYKKGEVAGRTAAEITALLGGAYLVEKGVPKVTGFVRTIGKRYIPTEKLVIPDVITGKKLFPTAPHKKHLPLFLKEKFVYHAGSPAFESEVRKFRKLFYVTRPGVEKIIPGKYDLPGVFVTPGRVGISPYFLKIPKTQWGLYGGAFFGEPATKFPRILKITPTSFKEAPAYLKTYHAKRVFVKGYGYSHWPKLAKWYLKQAEKGVVHIPTVKTEIEGVIPPETVVKKVGFRYYTKWQGVRVPIYEYKALGPSLDTKKITKGVKKVSDILGYKYHVPKRAYYVSPVSLVGSYLVSYKPSYKPPYYKAYKSLEAYKPYKVKPYKPVYKHYKALPYKAPVYELYYAKLPAYNAKLPAYKAPPYKPYKPYPPYVPKYEIAYVPPYTPKIIHPPFDLKARRYPYRPSKIRKPKRAYQPSVGAVALGWEEPMAYIEKAFVGKITGYELRPMIKKPSVEKGYLQYQQEMLTGPAYFKRSPREKARLIQQQRDTEKRMRAYTKYNKRIVQIQQHIATHRFFPLRGREKKAALKRMYKEKKTKYKQDKTLSELFGLSKIKLTKRGEKISKQKHMLKIQKALKTVPKPRRKAKKANYGQSKKIEHNLKKIFG